MNTAMLIAAAAVSTVASRMDRSQLQIGAYCLAPYARTEAHIEDVKDCGVDFLYGVPANDRKTLDLCHKHGIGVIATGAVPFWHGMGGEQAGQMKALRPMSGYADAMKAYVDHPAIWMLDYIDEPSALDYPYIGEVTEFLKKASPKGVIPYINLYPNYASVVGNTGKQVRNQLGTATYAEHVAAYEKDVNLDYVCFDFYLYSAYKASKEGRAKRLDTFYSNFDDLVAMCRKTGKSLWYIPQVNSALKDLWLTENHLRFQAFLAMCYGTEVINWACWTRLASGETPDMPGLTGWWHNNVLDLQGNRTEQYLKLKHVNAELKAIGPSYMKYRTIATKREADFTVGEMVSRKGKGKALFVLAANDPWDEKPSTVKYVFKAEGAVKVTSNIGEMRPVKQADGTYAISLKANQAALIEFGVAGGKTLDTKTQWIMTGVKNPHRPSLTGGTEMSIFGLTCYVATGTDMNLDFPLRSDRYFSAENKYFAVRYRLLSNLKQGGACFFSTKKVAYNGHYKQFPIVGNGTWQNAIVDMSTCKDYAGTITGFRVDIGNPTAPGDKLWLSRVGFFSTKEDAAEFLAGGNEREDYFRETDLIEKNFRVLIPGGTISEGWNKADFSIVTKGIPAGEGELVVARDGEVVPSFVNKRGFAWYVANKAGKYELVRVDKSKVKPLDDKAIRRFGLVTKNAKPKAFFQRERLRITGWGMGSFSCDFDRRLLEDMVECGLDTTIGHKWGAQFLQAADELGIEVYCGGMNVKSPTCGQEFADHPSYAGDYVIDEPGTDAYPMWAEVCRNYVKNTGRTPFINLLPMYANAAQLKYGASAAAIEYYDPDPNLFRKYCEKYCDQIDTFYMCTDIYPLNWVRGHKTTYRDYVESINIIASVARERNREFWCCIQPFGWIKSKRNPNAAEFRWQIYSMLSFGCRALHCWRYVGYNDEFPALVTPAGIRSPTWYEARTAFREIKKIGDLYCTYRNLGAFTVNCTEKTPYLKMTNEYRNFDTIKRLESKEPLLVGCFKKKSGEGTAFTVVNMTELEDDAEATVKIDLGALGDRALPPANGSAGTQTGALGDRALPPVNGSAGTQTGALGDRALPPVNGSAGTPCTQHGGKKATVWQKGIPRVAAVDVNGFITIELEGGEGVFVTVD